MDCVVAPLLHNQDAPADAVSTTLLPWQNAVGPLASTVAVGLAFTTTFTGADVLEQPPG